MALEATSEDLQRERQASYFQRIALADAEKWAKRDGRADQVLDECPADLRAWEWRYLKRSSPAEPDGLRSATTGEVWDAVVSPDGRRRPIPRRILRLHDQALGCRHQRDSSSGRFEGMRRVDLQCGVRQSTGNALVSASARSRTAIIWDVESGEPLHVLRGHVDNVRCAVFSPDGGAVVTGAWDVVPSSGWSARTGEPIGGYQTSTGWITRVAFSPDGRWVAVGGSIGAGPRSGSFSPAASHPDLREQVWPYPERCVQP